MNVDQREWNQLVENIGYIRAKVESIDGLPERVATLESDGESTRKELALLSKRGARRTNVVIALVSAAGALTSGGAAAIAIILK